MRELTEKELQLMGRTAPKSHLATWSLWRVLILGGFGFGTLLLIAMANHSDAEDLSTLFLVVAGLLFYFVPAYVAYQNRHHNFDAIFLLNIFLGWTFIGWVVALVWATVKPAPAPQLTTVQKGSKEIGQDDQVEL